ncbi:MAG: pyridoxal-phosphate dependent enzyme [Cyclobacteriaceae bacterium]|nr:pyridoxal-phosphate dependent enzyme [Cyclobacteriaceae bacterium]
MDIIPKSKISCDEIPHPAARAQNIRLLLLRLDKTHPVVSGNKWYKLKYNLLEAQKQGYKKLLTFGGAYSNHLAATAEACRIAGLEGIGVIRGEPTSIMNPTLLFAIKCGMDLYYVTRAEYRLKNQPEFIKHLQEDIGPFYLVPEGGSNEAGVKGAREIIGDIPESFDYLCCAVGTGGTVSGLISGCKAAKKVIGFSALKGGGFLNDEVKRMLIGEPKTPWEIITDYHFGGYAKINEDLILFIRKFHDEFNIRLDPVYTGKMMYGLIDKIKSGYFPKGSTVMAIHTGGLQGVEGMEQRLGIKFFDKD